MQDKSTTFRVVDAAILPVKPISPNRLKIMLAGIFGGVMGSLGLLLLLEQLDGSVKDLDFVKGLGAPVLAVIPLMEDQEQLARQRRRSCYFMVAAGGYLLVMLCLPVLELLGIPYMDRLLDGAEPQQTSQNVRQLSP